MTFRAVITGVALLIFVGWFADASDRSSKWSAVRRHYLAGHPACEFCGATTGLQVHHVVPISIDRTKELDPENLITLCVEDHLRWGHLGDDNHGYNLDVRADSAWWREKVKNRNTGGRKP